LVGTPLCALQNTCWRLTGPSRRTFASGLRPPARPLMGDVMREDERTGLRGGNREHMALSDEPEGLESIAISP
jgi:hypothetical protein